MKRPDEEEMYDEHLMQALRQLDHAPPQVDAATIANRARTRDFRRNVLRAAGILLALGLLGGMAYAAPGSAIRRWIQSVLRGSAVDSIPRVQVSVPDPPSSGIAVDPGARLDIRFTTRAPGGRVRVSLIDGPEVVVRAPAGAAAFAADLGRLVITNRDSTALFDIRIPKSALRVEVLVGAVRIFLKDGDRIQAGAQS